MTNWTITFNQAAAAQACKQSVRKMAEHLGGISEYGRDTPVPVATVLEVLGLDEALWALSAIGAEKVLRLWSADCAEHVLHHFEDVHPDDRRPREAIRVARLRVHGLASSAAEAAAEDAAGDAAWDAEREWQVERLRWYLNS